MFELIADLNEADLNSKYVDIIENFDIDLLHDELDYIENVNETDCDVTISVGSGGDDGDVTISEKACGGDGDGVSVLNVEVSGETMALVMCSEISVADSKISVSNGGI